ncbi:MAG: LPS assembly protein LptD [Bryobacteraceae bacterium]
MPPPPQTTEARPQSTNPALPIKTPRPNAPSEGQVLVGAITQEMDSSWYHLRGHAHVETTTMALDADAVDYNRDTGDATATGHVRFENFVTGEKLQCDHAEYNVNEETGKFYIVNGTSPAKVESKPGLLTTSNPFYFQARWAERIKDKYILYQGFVTDCKVPKPWWRLRGRRFVIYPREKALAYRSVFFIRWVPLLYMPAFYKSLERNPRESGFLSPNIGNSSRYGEMVGLGYYWAINPSADLLYRAQYYTSAGLASNFAFREKIKPGTDFSVIAYGIDDQGGPKRLATPGFQITAKGRADLGDGWFAGGELNYLSSFQFRQQFSESFSEAIFNESHTTGYVTKHVDTWAVNIVTDRIQTFDFNPAEPNDAVIIRHLPEGEFLMRETELPTTIPLYFSMEATAGAMDRSEPTVPNEVTITTPTFVNRVDLWPRLTTSLRLGDFSLVPSFTVHETEYGSSLSGNRALAGAILVSSRELTVDIIPPSLARVFRAPSWLGKKMKHVIEPRAEFHYVGGIGSEALRVIRFDDADLTTDTTELQLSLTNRLYVKRKDDGVDEVLSWQLSQIRFFDPTFGGAVVPGQRNVIWSSLSLTPFAFIDGPRDYSPVVSLVRFQKKVGVEWETDYDPLHKAVVANVVSADYRLAHYFISIGQAQMRDDPPNSPVTILSPTSGQFRGVVGYGEQNRRGLSGAMSFYYDYKTGTLEYMAAQATYNTDCCGFSVQYRRLNYGGRDETQILGSFGIANIGSVGTLKRQERIF